MKGEDFDIVHKILVLGESGVGKTNLLTRYTENYFDPLQKPTLGLDFKHLIRVIAGRKVKVQIWDTAGQERFQSVTLKTIVGSQGIVLVYDVTRRETFQKLDKWIKLIRETLDKDVKIIIIGNKSDLEEARSITSEEGKHYSEKNNCFFMETSALTNKDNCVHKAFDILLDESLKEVLLKEELEEEQENTRTRMSSVKLKNSTVATPKKGCC